MTVQKLIFLLLLSLSQIAYSLDASSLKEMMGGSGKLTILDVRPLALYKKSHIPNAINIPSLLLCKKKIPFVGDVVVYGDGVSASVSESSITCLKDKVDGTVYLLRGGYPAWTELSSGVGSDQGVSLSQDLFVSYQRLVNLSNASVPPVLLDLRISESKENLSEHFPASPVVALSSSASQAVSSVVAEASAYRDRFIVLIGDDVAIVREVAGKLHAAGLKRVARLVGGEHSLKSRGVSEEAKSVL